MREVDLTIKLERADAAVAPVMQPDLRADLDELRSQLARRADHLDEAISRLEAVRDGYAARGRVRADLRSRIQLEALRELRGRPDELAAIPGHLADWRAEAVKRLGASDPVVRELDISVAQWQFASGDVAGAHARLLADDLALPLERPGHASGRVVDEHGAPVAGATVVSGESLLADTIGLWPAGSQRKTTTRADGTFELEAPSDGVMIARLADRWSRPAKVGEGATLALAPTSHIEGHIDLRGEAATNVTIMARDPSYDPGWMTVIAPARADGTFTLDGVPRGAVVVHAVVGRLGTEKLAGTPVTVDRPVVTGVSLAVPTSKRVVHVVVRSTVGIALTRAEVLLIPGQIASTNVAALDKIVQEFQQRSALPIEREHAPARVLEVAKPGDVFVTVPEAPEGVASACAIGMPAESGDPEMQQKVANHLDKIEVHCVPLDEHAEVVLVEVPPWPRFD
jgi:hypothetical protein